MISQFLYSQERGLDERINEAFTPIANWWEGLILHNFPGTEIPTIIFLLVGGALFFTIYFGFVNIRHFATAINTVRGKYDSLENNKKTDLDKNNNVSDNVKHILKLIKHKDYSKKELHSFYKKLGLRRPKF